MSTTPDPTIAAEVRFVEEGHHTWLAHDADGWHVRVHSDTEAGKTYRVTIVAARGAGAPVHITCESSGGQHRDHGTYTNANGIPCKHAAGVLRRLARHRIVLWVSSWTNGNRAIGTSCWVATDEAVVADGRSDLIVRSIHEVEEGVRVQANRDGSYGLPPFQGLNPGFQPLYDETYRAAVSALADQAALDHAYTVAAEGPGGDPFAGFPT